MKKLAILTALVITGITSVTFMLGFTKEDDQLVNLPGIELNDTLGHIDSDIENKLFIGVEENSTEQKKEFIKWVDFNPSAKIIERAQKAHKEFVKLKVMEDIGTCELLAYLAIQNGNKFSLKTDTTTLNKIVNELKQGDRSRFDKTKDNKWYKRHVESFHAALDGIICKKTGTTTGVHPIAKGFWTSGYDDFGTSRSYGYKRRHLGHDLFGSTGTPIMAVEGGIISELGWNRFGGWRVGIRSECGTRYYYYAHLRKGKPYPEELKIGDKVNSGQLIGWLGNTGYSRKPNVNMTSGKPHLHFGMQLIFDESQEDGVGEIWIDVYQICKFLEHHKITVPKIETPAG